MFFLMSLCLVACLPSLDANPTNVEVEDSGEATSSIVYVGMDDNIYTVDPLDGVPQTITEDASPSATGNETVVYQFPSWSPDSRKIAFIQVSGPPGDTERAAVHVQEVESGRRVEVYSSEREFPFYLYWSPDSERLSFLTNAVDGGLNLVVAPLSEDNAEVVDQGQPYYWAWSPDGQQLLVHVGGASQGRLEFITFEEEVRLERIDYTPSFFQAPAWSPDGGSLLIAVQGEDGQRELLRTDRQGQLVDTLTSFAGSIAFASSPDGSKVAYLSSQRAIPAGVVGSLSVQDLNGEGEVLTLDEDTIYAFFWSPDGEKIAYFVPLPGGPESRPRDVAQRDRPEFWLALHLLDVNTGLSRLITAFRPTEAFLGVLPYFDQYHRSATLWSPDSDSLVVPLLADSGAEEIWSISVEAGITSRRLVGGDFAFWSWR
jgi:Tol biopolymer transport system component